MPIGRIVAAWHVGEAHTQRIFPADIAPELGAVGLAEAQEHIRAGIESCSARNDDDVTVLGRDDTTRDLGAFRRIGGDG